VRQRYFYAAGVLQDIGNFLMEEDSPVVGAIMELEGMEDRELLQTISEIPTLNVHVELGVQKTKQRTKPTDPNDLFDLDFLSVAIPYCDCVVTERFWVDLVRRAELDKRYNTIIASDLFAIGPLLEE